MDSKNWRQASQAEQPPMDGAGGNWRTLLQPGSRQRIVNKIIDTMKPHLLLSGQGVEELKKIATRFEEKIYHTATSESDYLRRISLKMLKMESKSSGSVPIPHYQASQSIQQPQGQSLRIPMASNQPTVQGRPQLLAQSIQRNISFGGVQSSASLLFAMPFVNGLPENNMPNVMQNSTMQNIFGISQNSMGNSMVQQRVASNIYTNSRKQQMVQGWQNMQQVGPQQQIQQSSRFALQQHQQSVLRQQQQHLLGQQQMSRQSMLQNQQQQHLLGQQQIRQQTSFPDFPQRLMGEQNNFASISGQRQPNQNLQKQQLTGQQSNHPRMHQQQLGSQNYAVTLPQQQQLLGSQFGNTGMQTSQQPAHMFQQSKFLAQQQNQNGYALLQGGSQQQPQQQRMMPQMQSQTAQLQQQLGLQHNMHQRLQSSNAMLHQKNVMDPQKMFQSQRTPTEKPSTSLDSTCHTGNSDEQEEVYQKMKLMKDLYFADVHHIYQKICTKLQQHDSHPQKAKSESAEKLRICKHIVERIMQPLRLTKNNIHQFPKDKLPQLEKQILVVIGSHRPRKSGTTLTTLTGKSGVTDQPLERLLKVVKSMSSKALNASVGDIVSVVSMIDRIPGSETSEAESTATSSVKRRRIEVNPALTEEIKEINEHLIDTVVAFSDEVDIDPSLSSIAAEGTIVKCTYSEVSLSPKLKSQYCSAQMSRIQPLRLLVPANYPNCSPILLDKFPVEVSKEYHDLSVKVKSRFGISLRTLSHPMSLSEIATTWDDCSRTIITEYAHQSGGGTFSSKYSTWENFLTAT